MAVSNMKVLPGLKELEMATAIGMALVGAVYVTLFNVFAKGTPACGTPDISLVHVRWAKPDADAAVCKACGAAAERSAGGAGCNLGDF